MTPDEHLKKVMDMVVAGEREQARPLLIELLKIEQRRGPRLQAILGLIAVLNRRTERVESIRLCDEAIGLTREKDLRAKLIARKATFIFDEVGDLEHPRGQIVFAPNQLGFSTEADRDEYRALSERIMVVTKESETLIKEAAELAKESGDLTAQGEILSTMAENLGTHYMHYQMRSYAGNERLNTLWAKTLRRIVLKLGLPLSLVLAKHHRARLRQLEEASMGFFDRSIDIFDQAGKELEKGYALFSAGLQLRTFGQLHKAKTYLHRARPIAEKSGDKSLLTSIDDLLYSIKVRGKDIPDYVNGESRKERPNS